MVCVLSGCPIQAAPSDSLASELVLRDQSVLAVAESLARTTSWPIAIDADAQVNAGCAHVTLLLPAGTSYGAAMQMLAGALVPAGLRLERQGRGGVIHSIPNAPAPRGCESVARAVASQRMGEMPERPAVANSMPRTSTSTQSAPTGAPTTVRSRITRSELSAAIENPRTALQARVVPRVRDGRANGFVLYGIRVGTLLARAGFQNGDVVTHMNGIELAEGEPLVELFTRVRAPHHISVMGTRRDAPLSVEIDVVEPTR